AGDVRRRRRLPPRGFRRVRAAVGARARDLGRQAGRPLVTSDERASAPPASVPPGTSRHSAETASEASARSGGVLWHGRFGEGPSSELLAFSQSLSFDRRLAADDVVGSRAHVRGLVRAGILSDGEAKEILDA